MYSSASGQATADSGLSRQAAPRVHGNAHTSQYSSTGVAHRGPVVDVVVEIAMHAGAEEQDARVGQLYGPEWSAFGSVGQAKAGVLEGIAADGREPGTECTRRQSIQAKHPTWHCCTSVATFEVVYPVAAVVL